MAVKKEQTFEESLEKLEKIIGQLETGDLALDKAFEYYKEAMDLSLFCSNQLEKVEKEVLQIQKDRQGDLLVSLYETKGDSQG